MELQAQCLPIRLDNPDWHWVSALSRALKPQETVCLVLAQVCNEYQEVVNFPSIECDQKSSNTQTSLILIVMIKTSYLSRGQRLRQLNCLH